MTRSEQIDFEQAVYDAFGQVKDFTLAVRIARYFYEQAEKDFIERLAKFYPTLDYTFRSYLLQDFPELESKVKNCD